ncbi:DUF255 domain-containing protein [Rudanella paleaurantiibacter]|uniref:DUF255 domain-containing protein n=1 Tax=Rudanella paleaurantiibacter TaxID=2614655 RepID=A0A7J5U343_9BACT|nr:DUF255 domain-containing protein [Rudanella paleaurantiibacter]KAB7731414.1 DUF255 domain-containing protein [Rudanella paleaurantiibacter]
MRRFLLLSVFVLSTGLTAMADGVRFFQGSWGQLLSEAKRQNKPIFVDVYTTWCGPCKLMTSQAFPNPRVASRMNEHFVNYKLDAEKGDGQSIAKRYGVQGYPTSLFLTPDGKLLHRAIGYNGIDKFLAEAQKAISDAKEARTMAIWNAEYDRGERSAKFLRGMLLKQTEYDRATADVLDDYVKILPKADTLAADEIKFLSDVLSTTYTKAYLLLARQTTSVAGQAAKQPLLPGLTKALSRAEQFDFQDAVASQDEVQLEQLIKHINARQQAQNPALAKTPVEQKAILEREADDVRLRFYRASRLPAHYIALAKKIAETRLMTRTATELARADSLAYLQSQRIDSGVATQSTDSTATTTPQADRSAVSRLTALQLCDLARNLTEQSADKKDLAQALRWSERAVQLHNHPSTVLVHARLLNRAGRRTEAQRQLRDAISRQQPDHDSVPMLQAELNKL